ncbi:CBS domain-containing protein [Taklimakanibacter lacteus]|uniref:CBS domain-containing protein n=1 Tax=Taklimakanibacter lacteus TaxID=2268456 RepID=UPI000E664AC5
MIARELMTRDPVSISPQASVLEAAETMLRHRISGLPVVDSSGALVGMVTGSDLMRRAEIATGLRRSGFSEFQAGEERLAADYVRAHGKRVQHVMTGAPFVVPESASLEAIVDIMDRHNVKRVPVVDGRKLVGIVSRTDLLRALVEAVRHAPSESCGDREIKQRLLSIYTLESWAPLANIDVSVKDGNVEITGTISSEAQRAALIAAAESIPGVNCVTDKLVKTQISSARSPF